MVANTTSLNNASSKRLWKLRERFAGAPRTFVQSYLLW